MTQAIDRISETFADPCRALEALQHRQAARGPQHVIPRTIGGYHAWTISDWPLDKPLPA